MIPQWCGTCVVDGNNILVRSMKATERTALSADGVPTAALHVFVRTLSRFLREIQPERLVICWDAGHDYRSSIFPEYKGARTHDYTRPEDEQSPFWLAKRFLSLANIHHVFMPGIEADDLVGHYWRQRKPREPFVIVSGDRDLFQLLDIGVQQWRPMGEGVIDKWDGDKVLIEMGCSPARFPMMKALTGDTSDGIPGVPGIGPVRAAKILGDNGWDLDLACTHQKIEACAEIVKRNLLLVDLRSVNLKIDLPEPPLFAPTRPSDSEACMALLDFLDRYELSQIKRDFLGFTLFGKA